MIDFTRKVLRAVHPHSRSRSRSPTVHEHSDVRDMSLLERISTGHEDPAVTDRDYEADYNKNGQDSNFGETVAFEGNARGGDRNIEK